MTIAAGETEEKLMLNGLKILCFIVEKLPSFNTDLQIKHSNYVHLPRSLLNTFAYRIAS